MTRATHIRRGEERAESQHPPTQNAASRGRPGWIEVGIGITFRLQAERAKQPFAQKHTRRISDLACLAQATQIFSVQEKIEC
jgi:hypothetical protein